MSRSVTEIPSGWPNACEAAGGIDRDLERAVDCIGAGRLLFSIADALAKEMKHPAFAARAYRVLLARMAGQTLDQIARREGVSRERIRQVVFHIRRIVVARPDLFEGFNGLEHAVRYETLSIADQCRNRRWRKGFQ
ncbi:RNA polymerase subunit sigma-70 [Mycobacterium xenopi]|uniref:RNA polymerase subunit sigma-70 n=2 Tax=Mycobacterium TaxID=1763 RepID=A0AAW5SCR1_MYCBC|nr:MULTISPECIES: hypothetical protein [Mycobacterium]EUA17239.1 hypothetical protein I552_0440 [Mycobacterium xenopi 3993]KMV21738.1 RNA polymerase subunit sigma-70 [Mycobacterium heckeshornense]MCV6992942.1 RNA polymerase subunit sigma-70 [Mycobacterium bouchedurhonense]MCV6993151.1 RNA polymerase subunit sigma-70 [Mycobacterium timonense]MDA3642359.1 RNA polymerase subunit sigma-70 [Mycobacterium xenopi]